MTTGAPTQDGTWVPASSPNAPLLSADAKRDVSEIPQQRAMLKQTLGASMMTIAHTTLGAPRRFDPDRISLTAHE